jgi:hypothetical protein
VTLSWADNADNETGFRIERSTDGVNFAVIGTAAANATSFVDLGAAASTAYVYRVRAYNAAGNSAYADPAGATTPIQFALSDGTTQGNWRGVYGSDGYALPDGGNAALPAYAHLSVVGAFTYTWAAATADPRALQDSAGTGRHATCWYSGSSFTYDLALTDGAAHRVTFYAVDWDQNNIRHEQVDVIDADTGAVLDSRDLANFTDGRYLAWDLRGHVLIRVTNLGSNAVVGGIFFDTFAGAVPTTVVSCEEPTPGLAIFIGRPED